MWTYVFVSFGYILGGIAGSYGNSMFNHLRDCQIVSQSGCTISHSFSSSSFHHHQQHMRVPIFPPKPILIPLLLRSQPRCYFHVEGSRWPVHTLLGPRSVLCFKFSKKWLPLSRALRHQLVQGFHQHPSLPTLWAP